MIPRNELYTALSLAIAAAAPERAAGLTPLPGVTKPDLQCVCFDFWPNMLRIVGTNGQHLACVDMTVTGVPKAGKFCMPLEKACEALMHLADGGTDPVTLSMFGLDQMMLIDGATVIMSDKHPGLYPEYSNMIAGNGEAARCSVFDHGMMRWVMDTLAPVCAGHIAVYSRMHGPALFSPSLPEEYQCIKRVTLAIKALKGE